MYLMKYIKLPKLKNNKNFEEIGNFNPIFDEDKEIFNIKEYSKIKKIDTNKILNSECYICYEKYSFQQRICLPFKCNHMICYKCFCKYCNSLKRENEINITNKVFCPFCREGVNKEWEFSKKIMHFKNKLGNREIGFVIPVSIYNI